MNILAIGAHPDDVEIGCGGALAAHVERGDRVWIVSMTAGERGTSLPFAIDVRKAEFVEAAARLGAQEALCLNYPDTEVPANAEVIRRLDQLILEYRIDRVYAPTSHEIHQDHRHTFEVAVAAARNVSQVLLYEGPSSIPGRFEAQIFIDIEAVAQKKWDAIRCHKSQGDKEILKIESIASLNKFRGYQARVGMAEAFTAFRYVELL